LEKKKKKKEKKKKIKKQKTKKEKKGTNLNVGGQAIFQTGFYAISATP